jgi:hypothetical protein
MKEPFTIEKLSERNKKAWSCTEKVWKAHESYTSSKPFLLKNWVHMKRLHIFQKQTYVCFMHQKTVAHFAYLQGRSISHLSFIFSIHCKFAPSPALSVKAWQVNCALEHRVYRVSKDISWYDSYHILSIETPLIWYDTQLNKGIDKNAWHNRMIWKNWYWSSINYFWIYQPSPNAQCTFFKKFILPSSWDQIHFNAFIPPLDIGSKTVFRLVWGKYTPSIEIRIKWY